MVKNCNTCNYCLLPSWGDPCNRCIKLSLWSPLYTKDIKKGITFPILNNLTPTEQSCTFKLLEEVGEVMQIIGKESGASGELVGTERDLSVTTKLVMEYMDVAQSSVTAVFTLCKKYNLDLGDVVREHEQKLEERGYLKC